MCDRPWETMTDADFEALLARSGPDTPPEEIVADVTPWRRAMNRILFGMALCAITLNFWSLNYILPAIGTVLLLLGFRALRRENRWLGGCFAVRGIQIRDGKNGTFVAMPQRKDAKGEYHDICFPTTAEMRQAINAAVLGEYERTAQRSAVRGAMRDTQAKPGRVHEGYKSRGVEAR